MKNIAQRFLLIFVFITSSHAVDSSLFNFSRMDETASFTVTIKNVGQGNCTIIRNHENNHYLIIDAGSLSDKPKNTEERLAEEFGFSEINSDIPLVNNSVTVVVSHSDKDHINLFKSVFGPNQPLLDRVERIYLGDHFENYFRIPETREFLTSFVKKVSGIESKLIALSHNLAGLNISDHLDDISYTLDRGKYYLFRPRVEGEGFLTERQRKNSKNVFEFIGVNAGAGTASQPSTDEDDTNMNSAIVRLSINGNNVIVMGDATGKTTEKILEAIADPTILEAELEVAAHHGAESEDTNYITWAAVTKPKRVALSSGFNRGYKHPTLTAISHYLATGLVSDEEIHELLIFNSIGHHIKTLRPNIHGLQFSRMDENHGEWGVFLTKKPIYATGSSGELRYTYSDTGKLVRFWRER